MKVSKQSVLAALDSVEDPDLKKSLVALGMIKELVISDTTVAFTLELTTPACPLKEHLKNACIAAVQAVYPNVSLDITFSAQVTSSLSKNQAIPNVKNLIGVASGKGGVGKSTVAANLALALAHSGARVGLVDADIFGPSVPTLFDCQNERPVVVKKDDKNCLLPIKKYGIQLISMGLLVPVDQAIVWRGPMASTALRQILGDTQWEDLDYLIVDLPPGTSDIPLTMAQAFEMTGVVIVSTPQQVALADVRKSIAMFEQPQINVKILGLIENMAYFSTEELPNKRFYLFGKQGAEHLAEEKQVPFLGALPLYEKMSNAADTGLPVFLHEGPERASFLDISQRLAQEIAKHNAAAHVTA